MKQREIKFRAKNGKGWLYFTLEQLINGSAENFIENNLKNWSEYTGLKDKNGKEIYEGDIVKNETKATTNLEVAWDSERGLWRAYGKKWVNQKLVPFHIGGLGIRAREVIGNIYENPELL